MESEWAKGQKEARIIDTLEPVITQHRLVVAGSFLREDVKVDDRNYSFLYQLTHITRERKCLVHDDRLDAVAGAVAHFQRNMAQDVDESKKALMEAEMEMEIEDFIESHMQTKMGRGYRRSVHRRKDDPAEREMVWSNQWR